MSLEARSNVLLSPADDRDYAVLDFLTNPEAAIAERFEVWQPPTIENQVAGSCTAQAAINIIECLFYKVFGIHKEHSVGYTYATSFSTSDTPGIEPRVAMKSLLKEGVLLRSEWECDDENPLCRLKLSLLPPEIHAKAKKYIKAYVRINTKEEMQRYMMQYGLPVLAVAPMSAFSFGAGYHAVAVYGWMPLSEAREKYVYSQDRDLMYTNSWGEWNPKGLLAWEQITEMWGVIPRDDIVPEDVKGHWCEKDILYLMGQGVVNGYEDGAVRPDKLITRAEVFALLARVLRGGEQK
jgi:hypothetical protein